MGKFYIPIQNIQNQDINERVIQQNPRAESATFFLRLCFFDSIVDTPAPISSGILLQNCIIQRSSSSSHCMRALTAPHHRAITSNQILTVGKTRLGKFIGALSEYRVKQIMEGIYLDFQKSHSIFCRFGGVFSIV